jgi:lipopolysaccharide transport system ATP-binding protein
LKILSRITEPTTGRAEIYGRVGSLLEVGTGFDRDLTGRENMYLNGAILGMTKREISRKADEIIDFSGVEKFIDTPVKYYSSGMQVRLAFAIAAHLEPEILIIDEVLAVGDAAFQKKCLGKMEQAAKHGRTVLFVSHNMVAVQELCDRGILLTDGTVTGSGTSAEVVGTYLNSLEKRATSDLSERADRQGAGHVRVSRMEIVGAAASNSVVLVTGQAASFTFHLTGVLPRMSCIFTIYDQHGQPIASFNSNLRGQNDAREPGIGARCICRIAELLLLPGRYRMNVAIETDGELQDHVEGAAVFEVEGGRLEGRRLTDAGRHGSVYFKHQWTLPADGIRQA